MSVKLEADHRKLIKTCRVEGNLIADIKHQAFQNFIIILVKVMFKNICGKQNIDRSIRPGCRIIAV